MLCFPILKEINAEKKVLIGLTFSCCINNDSGAHESAWLQRVSRMIFMVLTGYPVNRGIKMRARMLTAIDVIPVPSWSTFVITGYLFLTKRQSILPPKLFRQL